MARTLLTVLLLSTLAWTPAAAQEQAADPGWLRQAWRWKDLGSAAGLPTPGADALVYTDDGTPWASTALGIAWFDGHAWRQVAGHDSVAMPVAALEPLGAGSVLVAAGGRLYRADRESTRLLPVAVAGVAHAVVDAVPLDVSSALVLAEARDGSRRLMRLETSAPEGSPWVSEFPSPRDAGELLGLRRGRTGRPWLETSDALWVRTGGAWSAVLRGDGLGIAAVAALSSDFGIAGVDRPADMRGLWVWADGGSPRRVAPSRGAFVQALEVFGAHRAVAVLEGGRVMELGDGGWSVRQGPHSPLSRARVLVARRGRGVWVGGDDSLYWIEGAPSPWRQWRVQPPDPRNHVSALLVREGGELWIGTEDGIVVRDPAGGSRSLDAIHGRPLGRVADLAEDAAGRVWVVAAGSGAWVLEEGRWRHLAADGAASRLRGVSPGTGGTTWLVPESPGRRGSHGASTWALRASSGELASWDGAGEAPPATVRDVLETPDGVVWFATDAGLSRYAEGRWRHLSSADGLLSTAVATLDLDGEGRLWFAHADRGFGFVSAAGEVRYPEAVEDAARTRVRDIAADPAGDVLWLATADGLARYAQGIWSRLDASTGLPDADLRRVTVAGERVVVGTAGAGIASLDVGAWTSTEPTVQLRRLEIDDGVMEARWEPVAAWGRVPGHLLRTRYRVGAGHWSPWGVHRGITAEVRGEGTTLEVQVAGPLGERGPTGRWSADAGSGWGGPRVVLPLAVLATVLSLLMAVRWVERRRRERSVRESERRYLELLQQAPDVIFTLDLEGTVLSVNEAGERLLGRGDRAVRGQRLEDLVARDSALMVRRMLLDALEGQETATYLLEAGDDGVPRIPLEVRTREVMEDGVIVALQGIGREVSERQRAGRALRNLTVSLAARRGDDLFEALVAGLVRELGVSLAFVGEIADSGGGRVRILASRSEEGDEELRDYSLEGTPCAKVLEGGACIVARGVRQAYPEDEMLQELRAESYLGTPLFDSDGRVFGLIVVLDTEPLEDPEVPKQILRVFSVRVADELERQRARPGGGEAAYGHDGVEPPEAERRSA